MDRSWMFLPHRIGNAVFTEGMKSFMDSAKNHLNEDNQTRCPCRICQNAKFHTLNDIYRHLFVSGFARHYTRWTLHGEDDEEEIGNDSESESDGDENDEIVDLLNDVRGPIDMETEAGDNSGNSSSQADYYDYLLGESQRELYPGCTSYSALTFVVKLMHIKVLSRMSNKYFNMLLQVLVKSHPEGAVIPSSFNEAKTMLHGLGLGYESIHACVFDCALFWKENEKLERCPVCGEPRYKTRDGKRKKIPQKVLRYFPLKARLQRLYMSRHTATEMRWHKDQRINEEGMLRHPADGEEWKNFDKQYPWFSQDPRNVRLGLATDGFNPFGNMSNSHSIWPVILVPYNLPPWRCMKEMFSMMVLLIPGPNSPGKDIDVYLRPLVDELKELWEDGIRTYDASKEESFRLHACVLWTINDFPAYGNLSSWSTKGYLACPICNKDITSDPLKCKLCYMGHRRSLPPCHPWRELTNEFNGKVEHRPAPRKFSGDEILHQVEQVKMRQPGKHVNNPDRTKKREPIELNWTKKSIFFELEYWSKLNLRHNIDVMHCEKNIFDSVIGTILKIDGKTKDTDNARRDLKAMNIRSELHLRLEGTKWRKPHARYSLNVKQCKEFCEFVKSVKYPDGYAAEYLHATETGEWPNAIDRFETQHKNSKKGWDIGAKVLWDEMIYLRNEATFPDGSRKMTDDEICTHVLGAKSGYIKGCGFGPQPAGTHSRTSVQKTQELEDQLEQTTHTVECQQASLQSQAEVIKSLEQKNKQIEEKNNELSERQGKIEEMLAKFMSSQIPNNFLG